MPYLSAIIQAVFFPLLIICVFIYPELRGNKKLILYTWYRNKSDYDKVIGNENSNKTLKYEEWISVGKERVSNIEKSGESVIKIAVIPEVFFSWLKGNTLENTQESREKYAHYIFSLCNEVGAECII